jgi:hypothetical protein
LTLAIGSNLTQQGERRNKQEKIKERMEQFRDSSFAEKRAIVANELFICNLYPLLESYERKDGDGVKRALDRLVASVRMLTEDMRRSQGLNSYGLFGSDEEPQIKMGRKTPQTDKFLFESPSPVKSRGKPNTPKKKAEGEGPMLKIGPQARSAAPSSKYVMY